jgi:CRP-like cAMP-binding protein
MVVYLVGSTDYKINATEYNQSWIFPWSASNMTSGLNLDSKQLARLKTVFAKIRHFESLPREVLARVEAIAVPRHFDAGQVIYIEGEPADVFYLLERGWVKATRMSRDGREQAMLFLESGEIFGDIAVFSGTTYPGTVVALEDVEVWAIPAGKFLALTKQSSALAMAIIHHLSDRVLHYIGLVEDLSLRNVESRLANTLLQHAESLNGQLLVPRRHWTTFDEMAVRLGTVRDVLSRALKTLEVEGLLRVEKQAIVLLDPKGLAERGNS